VRFDAASCGSRHRESSIRYRSRDIWCQLPRPFRELNLSALHPHDQDTPVYLTLLPVESRRVPRCGVPSHRRTTQSFSTETDSRRSPVRAGPWTTDPSVMEYLLPWHGQLIVPLETRSSSHPSWVHTMPNPRNSPGDGWVTTTRRSGNTAPPPTGISLVGTIACPHPAPVGAGAAAGAGVASGRPPDRPHAPTTAAMPAIAPAVASTTALRDNTGPASATPTRRPSHRLPC
jgi:hypothetical protein